MISDARNERIVRRCCCIGHKESSVGIAREDRRIWEGELAVRLSADGNATSRSTYDWLEADRGRV